MLGPQEEAPFALGLEEREVEGEGPPAQGEGEA